MSKSVGKVMLAGGLGYLIGEVTRITLIVGLVLLRSVLYMPHALESALWDIIPYVSAVLALVIAIAGALILCRARR